MSPIRTLLCFAFWLLLFYPLTARAEPMKLVYYDNYAPRSFMAADGKMHGIIIDIIDEALKRRLGVELVHEGYPWARAQDMVKTGSADAFVTVPTAARKKFTTISKEPLFNFENFIGAPVHSPKLEQLRQVTSISGLKEFTMVDYLGNGWTKSALKGLKVYWLPDYKSIFPFLLQGKADAVLLSEVGIFNIEKLGYQEKITVLPQPVSSISFHLCINNNSPYVKILDDFDKEIVKMREEGVIQAIQDKYYKE